MHSGTGDLTAISALAMLPESEARDQITRFMMQYKFAVDEMQTKISILQQEFQHLHRYNPIEHVTSRLKPLRSILEKLDRRGIEPSLDAIRANITDIAGLRVTCSFIADTYHVLEALTRHTDLQVVEVKDYIAKPKPNGYKSLHAILEVPVYLSNGPVPVIVEVQIRTIAMDFWASLEHKIYYKYDGAVPRDLVASLTEAADVASQLDHRMEQLHTEIRDLRAGAEAPGLVDAGTLDMTTADLQMMASKLP